jgi:hypothetical protein
MTTSKLLWNSVLSTPYAKYCCTDVKDLYLETSLERYEYMRLPAHLILEEFLQAYKLQGKVYKGYLYLEIRKGMYGLPQARILANQLLRKRLAPHGYTEAKHTPGLWHHHTRPITFPLVVDDFGIKYVGNEHAQHVITILEKYYTVATDWTDSLYCGIQLEWDYDYPTRHLDISMPKYVAAKPAPIDKTPPLPPEKHKRVQKIVGSFLYYGRAVNLTILKTLNSLARQQSKPTTTTLANTNHLLDYLATHPDTIIRYYPSDMLLQVHSGASYLNEPDSRSTTGGHYFLGKPIQNNQPIWLNGPVHTLCTVLKLVAASAAEAELGALFLNAQEVKIL